MIFGLNNEKFTILGLGAFLFKTESDADSVSLDDRVQTILRYHLYFDFAFMAGVYPGITSLCMMAREKVHSSVKKVLYLLAAFQLMAWAADIIENYVCSNGSKCLILETNLDGIILLLS